MEYKPSRVFNRNQDKDLIVEKLPNSKKSIMSLEDIYEEFWEFINEENEEFIDFIKKDARRRNIRVAQ